MIIGATKGGRRYKHHYRKTKYRYHPKRHYKKTFKYRPIFKDFKKTLEEIKKVPKSIDNIVLNNVNLDLEKNIKKTPKKTPKKTTKRWSTRVKCASLSNKECKTKKKCIYVKGKTRKYCRRSYNITK